MAAVASVWVAKLIANEMVTRELTCRRARRDAADAAAVTLFKVTPVFTARSWITAGM